jgi:thiamine biosynthesis lipoprotein
VADTVSTTLMIAGKNDFVRIARAMGVSCALLLTDDGELYITPAMQARLVFPDPPRRLVVTESLGGTCAP